MDAVVSRDEFALLTLRQAFWRSDAALQPVVSFLYKHATLGTPSSAVGAASLLEFLLPLAELDESSSSTTSSFVHDVAYMSPARASLMRVCHALRTVISARQLWAVLPCVTGLVARSAECIWALREASLQLIVLLQLSSVASSDLPSDHPRTAALQKCGEALDTSGDRARLNLLADDLRRLHAVTFSSTPSSGLSTVISLSAADIASLVLLRGCHALTEIAMACPQFPLQAAQRALPASSFISSHDSDLVSSASISLASALDGRGVFEFPAPLPSFAVVCAHLDERSPRGVRCPRAVDSCGRSRSPTLQIDVDASQALVHHLVGDLSGVARARHLFFHAPAPPVRHLQADLERMIAAESEFHCCEIECGVQLQESVANALLSVDKIVCFLRAQDEHVSSAPFTLARAWFSRGCRMLMSLSETMRPLSVQCLPTALAATLVAPLVSVTPLPAPSPPPSSFFGRTSASSPVAGVEYNINPMYQTQGESRTIPLVLPSSASCILPFAAHTPFMVGRAYTIDRIVATLASPAARAVVFVSGPSGMGCSAIVAQAVRRLIELHASPSHSIAASISAAQAGQLTATLDALSAAARRDSRHNTAAFAASSYSTLSFSRSGSPTPAAVIAAAATQLATRHSTFGPSQSPGSVVTFASPLVASAPRPAPVFTFDAAEPLSVTPAHTVVSPLARLPFVLHLMARTASEVDSALLRAGRDRSNELGLNVATALDSQVFEALAAYLDGKQLPHSMQSPPDYVLLVLEQATTASIAQLCMRVPALGRRAGVSLLASSSGRLRVADNLPEHLRSVVAAAKSVSLSSPVSPQSNPAAVLDSLEIRVDSLLPDASMRLLRALLPGTARALLHVDNSILLDEVLKHRLCNSPLALRIFAAAAAAELVLHDSHEQPESVASIERASAWLDEWICRFDSTYQDIESELNAGGDVSDGLQDKLIGGDEDSLDIDQDMDAPKFLRAPTKRFSVSKSPLMRSPTVLAPNSLSLSTVVHALVRMILYRAYGSDTVQETSDAQNSARIQSHHRLAHRASVALASDRERASSLRLLHWVAWNTLACQGETGCGSGFGARAPLALLHRRHGTAFEAAQQQRSSISDLDLEDQEVQMITGGRDSVMPAKHLTMSTLLPPPGDDFDSHAAAYALAVSVRSRTALIDIVDTHLTTGLTAAPAEHDLQQYLVADEPSLGTHALVARALCHELRARAADDSLAALEVISEHLQQNARDDRLAQARLKALAPACVPLLDALDAVLSKERRRLISSAHDSDLQRAAVAAAFAIAPLGGEIQSSTLSQPVNTPSALLASGITTAAPAVAATAAALHWLVDCRRRLGVALQHANMDLRGAQHQFDRRLRLLLDMHGVIHGASLGNEHSTGASQAMRDAAHELTSTAYSSSDPNVVSTAVALTALPEQTPEVALAHEALARCQAARGDWRRARAHFEACVQVRSRCLGEQHPSVAATHYELASLLLSAAAAHGLRVIVGCGAPEVPESPKNTQVCFSPNSKSVTLRAVPSVSSLEAPAWAAIAELGCEHLEQCARIYSESVTAKPEGDEEPIKISSSTALLVFDALARARSNIASAFERIGLIPRAIQHLKEAVSIRRKAAQLAQAVSQTQTTSLISPTASTSIFSFMIPSTPSNTSIPPGEQGDAHTAAAERAVAALQARSGDYTTAIDTFERCIRMRGRLRTLAAADKSNKAADLLRECQLAEASDRCAAAAAYRSASTAALLLRSTPAPAPELVLISNPMFDGPAEPIPAPTPPPSQSQEQASLKRTVTALNDAALAHARAALRLRNIAVGEEHALTRAAQCMVDEFSAVESAAVEGDINKTVI